MVKSFAQLCAFFALFVLQLNNYYTKEHEEDTKSHKDLNEI